MRLALISDLHANELALEAVLADARGAGYDQLVCLGGPTASHPSSRLLSLREDLLATTPSERVDEYAIVEVRRARVSIDLRQVALDAGALASQIDGWDNPLAAPLRASYVP